MRRFHFKGNVETVKEKVTVFYLFGRPCRGWESLAKGIKTFNTPNVDVLCREIGLEMRLKTATETILASHT